MSTPQAKPGRTLWFVAFGLTFLVIGAVLGSLVMPVLPSLRGAGKESADAPAPPGKPPLEVDLVEGMPATLFVPEQVRKALGIQEKSYEVRPPREGPPLVMPGSTALDPARIMRVRTRFNAQVVEIGKVKGPGGKETGGETEERELRPGDKVSNGQELAVVWSIDVGSKKSDLVDALVQLRLDEDRLKRRTELWKSGSLPEDTLNQTRRDVVSDQNAMDRAERTLRTWNIPEDEIQAARAEAEQAVLRKGERDKEKERLWARSRIVAPRAGTVVERNVGEGEYVADNTINLFTIADVDTLLVLAYPPEDQLPVLLKLQEELKPEPLRWTVETTGAKLVGKPIDEISYLLDPNQHTAVVKGHIPNEGGRLRAGQFASVSVTMPPPRDVVEVPLTALAEDGRQSFVFVKPDPAKHNYTMRRVMVTRRFENTAYVRSRLTSEEASLTSDEAARKMQPRQPLRPGEHILTSGVLELRSALEDKLSKTGQE
jgi:cobalt-zinc-cadmium efflux system membrane fusion protein